MNFSRALALTFAFLTAPALLAQGRGVTEGQLEYFFSHPSDARLFKAALEAVQAHPDDARTPLRNLFRDEWILGRRSGPTLAQFDTLAQACGALDPDGVFLVEALSGPKAPAAWGQAGFRGYLRKHLPESINGRSTLDRLSTLPASPEDVVARFAFLIEIFENPPAQSLRAAMLSRLQSATPADMAGYSSALKTLPSGLTQFHVDQESADIRRTLGDRLFTLSPAVWSVTGGEVRDLVGASSRAPLAFFEKAAGYFRGRPTDRDPAASVLAVIGDLMNDPDKAFEVLDPEHDVGWFAWLHTAPVFRNIHKQPGLLARSYEILKRLAARDFGAMFPRTLLYYYRSEGYAGRVFGDLVRPRASGPASAAVLRAALDRSFLPEHREILAIDVLAGGDPLAPAWSGANTLARLEFAIQIYTHLLDDLPWQGRVNAHLSSPLLDGIVSGFLDLIRRPQPDSQRIVHLLEPLASHLELCHNGGDPGSAPAVLRLESEITSDITQAIAAITGAGGEAQMRAVDRFVDRLAMALRIRALVSRVLGHPPGWLASAREALRSRVFGIAVVVAGRTLYWTPDTTRWRAGIVQRIDRPLRDVLSETRDDGEADAWFAGVYLPLSRVHGFLRVVRAQSAPANPYLEWILSDPSKKAPRFEELFAALQTDRWVDSDAAILELAREHSASVLGGRNPWTLPPIMFFAGHWGVNSNLRIYRQLLDATLPQDGADWQTRAIAAKAIDELAAGRLPIGPAFGAGIGSVDQQQSIWSSARWVENLVTAAEWQDSPFTAGSRPLPWKDRLHSSRRSDLPFRFELRGNEAARRVDGQLRLRLARLLLPAVEGAPGPRVDELEAVAEIAVLLPNHTDNSAGGLEAARSFRLEIYRELNSAFQQASSPRDRERLARQMMRLYVAARSGPRPEPALDSILKTLASGGGQEADTAADIQDEQFALAAILNAATEDDLALARTWIDGQVGALFPPGWSKENAPIIVARFLERLADTNRADTRVRAFLQLRRRLQTVAGALVAETDRPAAFAADLDRLRRSLELIDTHVWFTRPDFNPKLYFRAAGPETDTWWPALVTLAWHDATLQDRILDALTVNRGKLDQRVESARSALLYLMLQHNEAVFATVALLAQNPDADRILKSRHVIRWRILNLRLLAETEGTEEASPASLASGVFSSLLANYRIAGTGSPDDQAVWERVFGSFDYFLPGELRRTKPIMVNLDKAVELAAEWHHSDHIPQLLRDAAAAFASSNGERGQELLRGAATPGGVMRVFDEILSRVGKSRDRPFYTGFYINAFTVNGKALSGTLAEGLEPPFFRGAVPAQMASVATLLESWGRRARSGPSDSVLDAAFRGSFDGIVARLIRGEGHPPEAGYIWGPVDELRHQNGLMPEKPVEFLRVAKWLADLERRFPEPELRALFAHGGRK